MSWFTGSIGNTFKEDSKQPLNNDKSPERGVKEDLSEITKTITRQFWGVASFIAPPLPSEHSNNRPNSSDSEPSAQEPIDGIRRDFDEIRGKLRSGISRLSNNIDVSEITKIASNFLQLDSDDDDVDDDGDGNSSDGDIDSAIGVTDEVVDFVRNIAMHPETWLDFPLNHEEDFELSELQQEHALAVERLAPRLGALRSELCPSYMSETSFWKIYFVLLHPRLERHAAQRLSTSSIMKARASLTHELKNRSYSENLPDSNSKSAHVESSAIETVKHPTHIDEMQIVDKSLTKNEPREEGNDEDDWLQEEISEIVSNRLTIPIENDEDVSFSDLEDDDDDDDDNDDSNIPIHYKNAA